MTRPDPKGALPSGALPLPSGAAGFIDHVGIAVADLDEALVLYRDLLGLELERIEEVPAENVRVAFLKLDRAGGAGHLELLAPLGEEGAIAAFIAKRGPGLHHVSVAAADVRTLMDRCAEAGLRLLDTEPRTGAGGKQIVFLHPKSAGGVLLELCGPGPG